MDQAITNEQIASQRQRVENHFKAKKMEIKKRLDDEFNRQVSQLEKWKNDKLAGLVSVILGELSLKEWQQGLPEPRDNKPLMRTLLVPHIEPIDRSRVLPKRKSKAGMVKEAIKAIQGELSIPIVMDWLDANRPDAHVDRKSIQTTLWRQEKDKKLRIIGKDRQTKIYKKVE